MGLGGVGVGGEQTIVVIHLIWFNWREREMCVCHPYCSAIHNQSHLSRLVDVASEGDARTGGPLAAVVRSTSKSWKNQ